MVDSQSILKHLTQEHFEFNLRGWKEPAAPFFAPSPEHTEMVAERGAILALHPERHLVYLPGAADLANEACSMAQAYQPTFQPAALHESSLEACLRQLGEHWEADFILCRKDPHGQILMEAAAVCFPSYWLPEEKIGLPIEAIHDPVPGLNASIGHKIHNLLDRLPTGYAWSRANWGLAASPERNQHPLCGVPRLHAEIPLEQIWLRMEYQALVRMPLTGGILFGIRPFSYPLLSLQNNPQAARAIAGQLVSMPVEMQMYKGIRPVTERVAAFLAAIA